VYTRTFKERGRIKRDVTRPVVSAINEDGVYLNKKQKNGFTKNVDRNKLSKEKFKMRQYVNLNC
jgi:hypothetical protein